MPCDLDLGTDDLTVFFSPRQICYCFSHDTMEYAIIFLHILPKFVLENCSVRLFIIYYLKKCFTMQFVNKDTPSI
jgi:hypothetical protein